MLPFPLKASFLPEFPVFHSDPDEDHFAIKDEEVGLENSSWNTCLADLGEWAFNFLKFVMVNNPSKKLIVPDIYIDPQDISRPKNLWYV